MNVLLEMRPALDGYSGIPQETRLLFRGLAGLDEVRVQGLLQSPNLAIEAGLPANPLQASRLPAAARLDRLSKVVVSLQQGPGANRLENLKRLGLAWLGPAAAAAGTLLGRKVPLTHFHPEPFKDWVWRAMFAKTLPVADFDRVTSLPFRVLRWPWSPTIAVAVSTAALGHAVFPRLDTRGIDVLLVETPYPGRPARGTRLVVRYHDAMPLLMPHTIKNRSIHRAAHFHALRRNACDGAWFACVSDSTRSDLLSVLPEVADRTVTIPNMISHHFDEIDAPASRVPEILWSRKNRAAPHGGGAAVAPEDLESGELPYLLMVSTIEPRKNHLGLLDAWELLRGGRFPRLNLVCVGAMGWDHESIVRRFTPWLARGGLHLLSDVPASDLGALYRNARATICPSFGEGFDFAGVEAMRCGGAVVASDLAVHREVYAGAAEYFNAYSPQEQARSIERVIAPEHAARRAELMAEGAKIATRYLPEAVMPQWAELLRRVTA